MSNVEAIQAAMRAAWEPISTAPAGRAIPRRYIDARGRPVTREVFEPDWVWTCRSSDGHVTRSFWLPKEERWNGYTKEAGPDLWQPIVTPEAP